jgi:hypothetical protein
MSSQYYLNEQKLIINLSNTKYEVLSEVCKDDYGFKCIGEDEESSNGCVAVV